MNKNAPFVIASPSTSPSTLLRAMSGVEWLRINSAKPFGPELTAEGQSRSSADIQEIATLARLAPPPKRPWRAGGWRAALHLAMTG